MSIQGRPGDERGPYKGTHFMAVRESESAGMHPWCSICQRKAKRQMHGVRISEKANVGRWPMGRFLFFCLRCCKKIQKAASEVRLG
jgi:hypothetical protein